MEKLKDALVGTLGIVGYIAWSVLLAGIVFMPLSVLNFPLWADILIILIIMNIPILNKLLEFVIWIWSFTIVISEPITVFSVFYFVIFGIYILTDVIPLVIDITAIFSNRNPYPDFDVAEDIPYLDVNRLAFATDEEVAKAQQNYAKEMYEYVKRKEKR